LSRTWAASAAAGAPIAPLSEVLDWVLLLRAVLARAHTSCWGDVAHTYGVHRHTLTRVARDLAQTPLRLLTVDAAPVLRQAFRTAVLDAIPPNNWLPHHSA